MIYNPFQSVKNYSNYTENEINELIKQAGNSKFLYDYLIDKLYFYSPNKYNTKNADQYNILPARKLWERETKEKELNINYLQ